MGITNLRPVFFLFMELCEHQVFARGFCCVWCDEEYLALLAEKYVQTRDELKYLLNPKERDFPANKNVSKFG